MAPAMLHVFSDLSALASNADIRGNFDQLLGYSKYHRSSHTTGEHTILHKQAFGHIQPQIQSDPQGSIQNVTQRTGK